MSSAAIKKKVFFGSGYSKSVFSGSGHFFFKTVPQENAPATASPIRR